MLEQGRTEGSTVGIQLPLTQPSAWSEAIWASKELVVVWDQRQEDVAA